MSRKAQAEHEMRLRINAHPKKKEAYGAAWDRINQSEKVAAEITKRYYFLSRGFGSGEFDLDSFRVGQAVSDSLLALFEHFQDGFVGEYRKHAGHNEKVDDLRAEMCPIKTKLFRCLFGCLCQVAGNIGE